MVSKGELMLIDMNTMSAKDAPDREKCIKTCIRDIEELCK